MRIAAIAIVVAAASTSWKVQALTLSGPWFIFYKPNSVERMVDPKGRLAQAIGAFRGISLAPVAGPMPAKVSATIEAFAFSAGSEEGNYELSKLRANAMKEDLIRGGVPGTCIKVEAMGDRSYRYSASGWPSDEAVVLSFGTGECFI